jgi:uncharacterized protein
MSTALDPRTGAFISPPAQLREPRREPPEFREPPPGFGRYPWWTPLAALAAGLVLLAIPLFALAKVAGDVPFAATIGEGLFLAVLLSLSFVLMKRTGGLPSAAELGLRPTPSRAAVGWVLVARLTVGILAAVYVSAVGHVTSNAPVAPVTGQGTIAAIDLVIAACLLAPLGEELFFRGFMYASLRGRVPAFWAALVTGLLFGAVHPIYGATAWNLVPILAMAGFAMCLLYERTGSLWPAIAFHVAMNIGVLYLVTGIVALPLGIIGGAGLLFLLAPWRLARRRAASSAA